MAIPKKVLDLQQPRGEKAEATRARALCESGLTRREVWARARECGWPARHTLAWYSRYTGQPIEERQFRLWLCRTIAAHEFLLGNTRGAREWAGGTMVTQPMAEGSRHERAIPGNARARQVEEGRRPRGGDPRRAR